MPHFELVWWPGTCSRVTLIALEELGVEFDDRVVPPGWGDDPEYLALNPKGKVPTLIVDGVALSENPAIVTYLSRLYPEAGLLPAGDLQLEADVLATMSWFTSAIHQLITRVRFPMMSNDDPASFARTREMAAEKLRSCFAAVEPRLADRDWLYGDWSVVDGYLLWLWFRAVGSGMDGSGLPRCADHARRCEQHPSVARALDREERRWQEILASGSLTIELPPHQVGRAPAVAAA